MKITGKIKMLLGLCVHRNCFKKADVDIEIPQCNYKGKLCKKCFKKLKEMEIFNIKEYK